MAEEEIDELNEEVEVVEPKGKSKTLILIVIISLVALIGGGGGTYFLLSSKDAEAKIAEEGEADGDEASEEEEMPDTPYYFSLNPPFVVNFVGKGRAKFLQVNIDGLTRNPSVKENITTHLPHIRNNMVFILSSKRYEELITPEGKEDLRKQLLTEIRSILKKETGNGDVEDIYFTSFVMQ